MLFKKHEQEAVVYKLLNNNFSTTQRTNDMQIFLFVFLTKFSYLDHLWKPPCSTFTAHQGASDPSLITLDLHMRLTAGVNANTGFLPTHCWTQLFITKMTKKG